MSNVDVSEKYSLNSESKPSPEKLVELGLHPIEVDIVSRLHSEAVGLVGSNDSEWTRTFLDTLRQLGETQDPPRLCFPNQLSGQWEKGGEWIFDLAWVECNKDESGEFDWRLSERLILACESEWRTGQYYVLEDFFKLSFVRSEYRLFIYSHKITDGNSPVDWCKNVCPPSLDNRYLAIGISTDRKDFYLDSWTR